MQERRISSERVNEALWLSGANGSFEVRSAPMPTAGTGEVVVEVDAIALNPADAMGGAMRRIVSPWVRYPSVIGTDVAGEVVQTGDGVSGLKVGDRVLGYAAGQERERNSPAEGAFQRYAVILERVCTLLPKNLSSEDAAVLPLALATAAAGLYEPDQLGLSLPQAEAKAEVKDQVVLVWGASTSVGSNAVQLARASGYEVLATASEKNHDYVRALGAEAVFDYRNRDVDAAIINALRNRRLAGTIAIGQGSLTHALKITAASEGGKRIASALPSPATKLRGALARRRGIRVSGIWGGTPIHSAVGPAVFNDFLPLALERGSYKAAPQAEIVGTSLGDIPKALEKLRAGVSARKLVVTLADEGTSTGQAE